MTETVTVAAEAGRLQIQTESAERSDLVTNTQLRDLALNGRNIGDLFKTIPGVIAGGTQTTSTVANVVGSFNINGTRNNQHEYTVDGVTNLNLGNNTGALVSINPDALEEVKILTSNYQAEFGQGRRRLHRPHHPLGHQPLPRRPALLQAPRVAQRQQLLQQRQRPAQAALPLRLLRVGLRRSGAARRHARATAGVFFFAAQEYYQQKTPAGAAQNIRVPTALERSGDFSQTRDGNGNAIVDPRSADRPAVPEQHHPVEPVRARACRR